MIRLENISVAFRTKETEVAAVRNASIEIEQGEIFGIVGSSGAGKSTLLRTINLLERPSSGAVFFAGEDITALTGAALRKRRQRIGMVFQHFNLLHTCTVHENVAFALKIAGKKQAEIHSRVPEILELVGLMDKACAYPAQLSGGQKQRVGIARAIANRPEVLLCDEPTSALDLETSSSILELLAEINRKTGITIVIISHEMSVIKTICTRVAVMDNGLIVENDTVYNVFASPKNKFTKQLVERTFNLEIPERHLNSMSGTLVRILFRGDRAEEPVLSKASKKFDISVNILHGKIEYIGNLPVGLLVVTLSGATGEVSRAIEYIKTNTASLEVLNEH